MRRGKRLLAVLLPMVLLLCGCGEISVHQKQNSLKIGVVLKHPDSPYWQDMQNGMQQAALDKNVELNLLYPTGSKESQEQTVLVEDMLESDIDALIYAPVDCYDTKWIKQSADEKEIKMLTVDDRAMDWLIPYVGTDNRTLGRMAAQFIQGQLPKGGSVLVLLGQFTQVSCKERLRGIQEQLAVAESDYDVIDMGYSSLTEEAAYAAVMSQEEEIGAVFCQNVNMAQGAIAALEEKGWDTVVVTVDTQEDGHQVLRRGKVDAIMEQDGYEIGYTAVEKAVQAIHTGETPQDVYFSSTYVQ